MARNLKSLTLMITASLAEGNLENIENQTIQWGLAKMMDTTRYFPNDK